METVEVVIRLPKEYLDEIKAWNSMFGTTMLNETDIAILSGTILPQGHGRLIDADALRTKLNTTLREKNISTDAEMLMVLVDLLDNAPVIVEADKEK